VQRDVAIEGTASPEESPRIIRVIRVTRVLRAIRVTRALRTIRR